MEIKPKTQKKTNSKQSYIMHSSVASGSVEQFVFP